MTLTPEMVASALSRINEAQKLLLDLDAGLRKAGAQDWAGNGPHEMNVAGCLVRDKAWIGAISGLNDVYVIIRAQSQRAVTDLDLLQALRAEIQTQSGLKDCYQEWEDTENLLSALIERAGGGV